jgi:hypothetical protein
MLTYAFKTTEEAKAFAESAVLLGMKALLLPAAAMVWVWPTAKDEVSYV